MSTSPKITLIYGYAVCIVAIITFLISTAQLVNSLIDLGNPLYAEWVNPESPSLASYNNYKMDILKAQPKESESSKVAFVPDEQTLKAMYESAKTDRIQSSPHRCYRSIIVDGILCVLCIVLFFTHWKWMRRLSKIE